MKYKDVVGAVEENAQVLIEQLEAINLGLKEGDMVKVSNISDDFVPTVSAFTAVLGGLVINHRLDKEQNE